VQRSRDAETFWLVETFDPAMGAPSRQERRTYETHQDRCGLAILLGLLGASLAEERYGNRTETHAC
jgi:hypothetical protein